MGPLLRWLIGKPRPVHGRSSLGVQDQLGEEYAKAIRAHQESLRRVKRLANHSANTGVGEIRALADAAKRSDEPSDIRGRDDP
jgi:hypothetical protein